MYQAQSVMTQTGLLLSTLKKCLKIRGVTYREIAKELALSEASVKRLFSEESFSLQRLERVCRMVDMSLLDLSRMARGHEREHSVVLSIEQEQAFADDIQLFATFYLLVNEWTIGEIQERFENDKVAMTGLLLKLDKLGLIDLEPKNRVRLRTPRTIQWRPDGPVRRHYWEQVKESFLGTGFDMTRTIPNAIFTLPTAALSDASIEIMRRKIEKLEREFDELAEADLSLPLDDRTGVGLFIGFRPWSFFDWLMG